MHSALPLLRRPLISSIGYSTIELPIDTTVYSSKYCKSLGLRVEGLGILGHASLDKAKV